MNQEYQISNTLLVEEDLYCSFCKPMTCRINKNQLKRKLMLSSFSQQKITKPKTLACYICGRQFGTKSLTLHLKPCKEKFKILQDQKTDKSLKIKLPDPPALLETVLSQAQAGCLQEEILSQYNQQARNTHKYKVLPACKYCGRTFNQESLASHMKACPKKTSYTESAEVDYGYKLQDKVKKPRTLVCCVCGRQFGITSLKIHYPQCQEKFKNQQLQKSFKQRNPAPQFSQENLDMVNNKTDWTLEEINEFNQKASTNFRNKAMVQCENCKRKFLPESYKRHEKNCKLINGDKVGSKSPSKQGEYPQSSSGYDIKQFKKPKVLMCHICGRQFGLTSLKIHQKNCVQKFINEEKKRPKNQRRPLPELNIDLEDFDINFADKWHIEKIEEYNQAANQVYKGCALFPCPICGRKFFEDSLKRHLNYCQKNAEDKKLKQEAGQASKQKEVKASPKKFEQHISKVQSNKSLVKPSQSLPKKNSDDLLSTSKTLNIKPIQANKDVLEEQPNFNHTIKQVNEELEGTLKQASNQLQFKQSIENTKNTNPVEENFEEVNINRVECSKCNRKFAQDRIQKHENICKGPTKKASQICEQKPSEVPIEENPRKPKRSDLSPVKMNKSQFKDFNEQTQSEKDLSSQLDQCPKCGKKFMPSKIEKHIVKCKDVAFKVKHKQKKEKIHEPVVEEQSEQLIKPFTPKPLKISERLEKQRSTKKIADKIKEDLRNSQEKEQKTNQNGLIGCRYCNRKFGSDRIEKHQNVCLNKKNFEEKETLSERQKLKSRQKPSNKINSFSKRQPQNIKKQALPEQREDENINLISCKSCGRKFASDRVQKHQKVCKGSIKKQEAIVEKTFVKKASKIEENQLFNSQEKTPQTIKKNVFNIKPVNKKVQEKKFLTSNPKDFSQKDMVKENIKFAEDLMNEIWDTKESPNRFYNASEALQNGKMVLGIPKVNKTAYEGGFYKRKPERQLSEEKDMNPKLEQIDNLQRVECQKCGRKFMEQRIQKHQQICKGKIQTPLNVPKRSFNRYVPQSRQKSSKKLITQKQSSQISESIIIPESKDIIKTFKEIKNMKINESYIDKELDKELEVINTSKPLKEIKSTGFGARNTYGGGEKFYSRQSVKKLDKLEDVEMGSSENVSAPYQSRHLQPIAKFHQTPKNSANQSNFNVKKWNK